MALKDSWKNKQDGVDYIFAEDVNDIAQAVIALEENGTSLTLDSVMSDTSSNAVENRVIKAYVDNQVGEFETALDTAIALCDSYIGGAIE